MSSIADNRKGILLEGNVFIQESPYISDQGSGALTIADTVTIKSTAVATSSATGALTVAGGMGVGGSAYIDADLDVNGVTTLDSTQINTTEGALSVSGTGPSSGIASTTDGAVSLTSAASGITLVGNAASSFSTSGAHNLSLASGAGVSLLTSGKAASDAITITASNAAGGITASSGTGGTLLTSSGTSTVALSSDADYDLQLRRYGTTTSSNTSKISISNERGTGSSAVELVSTLGGMTQTALTGWSAAATQGPFAITGTGSMSKILLNSVQDTDHLVLHLAALSNSELRILSDTVGDKAIRLIANFGGIHQSARTNYNVEVEQGPFSLLSTNTPDTLGSSIVSQTSSNGQDFLITCTADTPNTSRLILTGAGTSTDAILLSASTGGIESSSVTGFQVNVQAGPFNLISAGGSVGSMMQYTALAAGRDMTMELAGAVDSKLRILSAGTGTQAVDMVASAGGVRVQAAKMVSVQSTDTTDGIKIGTETADVPVTIGNSSNSTVVVGKHLVVSGNLTVSGTTTVIETTTVSIADNIVLVNSGPMGTGDAGVVAKRYQTLEASTSGDVLSDTPNASGSVLGGTSVTVALAPASSSITDFYKDYWLKVTYADSEVPAVVRKVKAYNGDTKVATIYGTSETDGLDMVVAPAVGDSYALYGHGFVASYFDESTNMYDIAYTNMSPDVAGAVNVTGRPDVYVGGLQIERDLQVSTINEFGSGGVTIEGVTVDDGDITGLSSINGNTLDKTITVSLSDAEGVSNGAFISDITQPGPYQLMVKDQSVGGANAIFMMSKSNATHNGQVNRLVSAQGANNQRLEIVWNSNQQPRLFYRRAPDDGSTRTYSIKITTV